MSADAKDSIRFAWLERYCATLTCNYSSEAPWQVDVDAPDFSKTSTFGGRTPQEAIDAAMEVLP